MKLERQLCSPTANILPIFFAISLFSLHLVGLFGWLANMFQSLVSFLKPLAQQLSEILICLYLKPYRLSENRHKRLRLHKGKFSCHITTIFSSLTWHAAFGRDEMAPLKLLEGRLSFFLEITLCKVWLLWNVTLLQTILPDQFLHHAGSSSAMQTLNASARMCYLLAVTSVVSNAYQGYSGTGRTQNWLSKLTMNPEKFWSLFSREGSRAQCGHVGSEAISTLLPRCNAATPRPVQSGKQANNLKQKIWKIFHYFVGVR